MVFIWGTIGFMNKGFRIFLYIFIFSAIGALVFFMYNPLGLDEFKVAKKVIEKKVKKNISKIDKLKIPPTLENFTYSSTKNGKIEWTLTSTSGTEEDNGDLINLEGIDIIFYSNDGSSNSLKASSGSYDSSTNNVKVDGDIILLTHGGLRMEAESMDYNVLSKVIESKDIVSVHGGRFDIKGTGFTLDVESGEFEIKNKVSGGFMYDFL